MKGRLLFTSSSTAVQNMAMDSALMESVRSTGVPILRIYSWKPAAISIGYFQGLHEEVDVKACEDAGVDIVRRITGGGAVFHRDEITYSIILPESMVSKNILASYGVLCGAVVDALTSLGLDAQFAPINDILVQGKKVSGNAQTRRGGVVLQHGTILTDVDVDLMFSLLKVPQEKMKGKLISQIKERVTSLKALGQENISAVEKAIATAFSSALQIQFDEDKPSEEEEGRTRQISAEKFSSPQWTQLR